MIELAVIKGRHGPGLPCCSMCTSRGRWLFTVGDNASAYLCNGCLMRCLSSLHDAAAGTADREATSLPDLDYSGRPA